MGLSRRSYVDIFGDILKFSSKGSTKTQILYGCNLNSVRLTLHLNALICMGLLVKEVETWKTVYITTPQGTRFLKGYFTKKSNLSPSVKPFRTQVKRVNMLQLVTSTTHLIVDSTLLVDLYDMEAGGHIQQGSV
ncbi:MAG: winged helix-turn-helix domain-containing protein [Candidatus Bathyarchaeia archaeon]